MLHSRNYVTTRASRAFQAGYEMISHQLRCWRDRSERAIEMGRFQDIKHLIIKLSVPHQGEGLLGRNPQLH